MTEKLYYGSSDSHVSEFEARVISCHGEEDGRFEIILDRTAFFPEGGGQPSDEGKLLFDGGEATVSHVFEKDGIITHICSSAIAKNTAVCGKLDFDKRFRRMQNHSGEHIISGIAHSLYGFENVGFHIGSEDTTLDFNGVLDDDQIRELETLANEAVWKNVPFTVLFPTDEELEALDYRSKKEIAGQVRLVRVEGYDLCACCAPHVFRSGEIGVIKIVSYIHYKGGVRLHILCGRDALEYFEYTDDSVFAVSRMLSTKHDELFSAVKRLSDELAEQKHATAEIRSGLAKLRAASLAPTDGNIVVIDPLLDTQDMRALANTGAGMAKGVCAVFSPKDGGYNYIIASGTADLRALAKEINRALNGRGGGSSAMIQGSVSCTERDICEYFGADRSY